MPGALKNRFHRDEVFDKAREDSEKILSWRAEQRERLKEVMEREEEMAFDKMCVAHRRRNQRWSARLKGNPLAEDLLVWEEKAHARVLANARLDEKRKRLETTEMRKTAHAMLQRAGNARDDLNELRMEKRMLLEEQHRLRSLKDIKSHEARVARIGTPKRNCKTLQHAYFTNGTFQTNRFLGSSSCPDLATRLPEASLEESFEFHPMSAPPKAAAAFQAVSSEQP